MKKPSIKSLFTLRFWIMRRRLGLWIAGMKGCECPSCEYHNALRAFGTYKQHGVQERWLGR